MSAISGIVTQNVDRLHHKAGSVNVVELHGRGDVVACINTECMFREPRTTFTESMEAMNQEWMKKNGLVQIQLSGGEEGEGGGVVRRRTARVGPVSPHPNSNTNPNPSPTLAQP